MKLLITALGYQIDKGANSGFGDVSTWAEPYIAKAVEIGITTGKSETQFGAKDVPTGKEISTWILRALGVDSSAAWNDTNEWLNELGLNIVSDNTSYNRDLLVKAMYEMLMVKPVNSDSSLIDKLIAADASLYNTAIKNGMITFDIADISAYVGNSRDIDWDGEQYIRLVKEKTGDFVMTSKNLKTWDEHELNFTGRYQDLNVISGEVLVTGEAFYYDEAGDLDIALEDYSGVSILDALISTDYEHWSYLSGKEPVYNNSEWNGLFGVDASTGKTLIRKIGTSYFVTTTFDNKFMIMLDNDVFISSGDKFEKHAYVLDSNKNDYGYYHGRSNVFDLFEGYPLFYKGLGMKETLTEFDGHMYTYIGGTMNIGNYNMFGQHFVDIVSYDAILRTANGTNWSVVYYQETPGVTKNQADYLTNDCRVELFVKDSELVAVMDDKTMSTSDGLNWKGQYNALQKFCTTVISDTTMNDYRTYNTGNVQVIKSRIFTAPEILYKDGYYYMINNNELCISQNLNEYIKIEGDNLGSFLGEHEQYIFMNGAIIDTGLVKDIFADISDAYTEKVNKVTEKEALINSIVNNNDYADMLEDYLGQTLSKLEMEALSSAVLGQDPELKVWYNTNDILYHYYKDSNGILFRALDGEERFDFVSIGIYKKNNPLYGLDIGDVLTKELIATMKLSLLNQSGAMNLTTYTMDNGRDDFITKYVVDSDTMVLVQMHFVEK